MIGRESSMDVREKLVELLTDNLPRCGNLPRWDNPLQLSCDEQVQRIADHLIMHGVTVQEWIPVTERLPEPWKQVLIYSRHDFCESAFYIGVPGKWRVTWNHEMLDADSVTHWIPLPEPPKGE